MNNSLMKNVSILRSSDNKIIIKFQKLDDSKISLYWTRETNPLTTNRYLISDNLQDEIIFDDPLNMKERIYFIVQNHSDGTSYLFGEQTLPIQGMTNLRDCGGYVNNEGKTIKWGKLYRANHFNSIESDSIHYLRNLKIKTVVDLRSFNEISKSPNKYIGEIITLHADPSAHTAELAAQFAAEPDNENEELIAFVTKKIQTEGINDPSVQVLEQYRNFVTGDKAKNSFSKMLHLLLDQDNSPCVLHCRGGKDRTGYAILLIMVILGISEDDIIYDYMLTRNNRLARNEYKMQQYKKITQNQQVLDYLLSLIDTRETFISEAFKMMKAISGTPIEYIKQELKFTENDCKKMRDIFLH